MTARINQVGYIGWRGIVGCEVIQLHELMTGFTGAGGAGKSTMIMSLNYALIPDSTAMVIRPLSDLSDIQTEGVDDLSGRISPDYGYAYVVLDYTNRHGEREVAGIQVEPTGGRANIIGWYVRNFPEGIRIQQLMAVEEDDSIHFPPLLKLKRHLAGRGIDLYDCKSVGEYGQVLYRAGLIPCSLANMADRRLYAKLQEATFCGGMTKEVIRKLKDYLLSPPTNLKEVVGGLQECANEVLMTRNAIATSKREIQLIQSTYGVGKLAVVTALHCITADLERAEKSIQLLSQKLANNRLTRDELNESIPTLEQDIESTENLKANSLKNALIELRRLADEKQKLSQLLEKAKEDTRKAQSISEKFNDGRSLWDEVCGKQQALSYVEICQWYDDAIKENNFSKVEKALKMRALQEEDNRLVKERDSTLSENLAQLTDATPLGRALTHLSRKDALAYEMALGGLADGIVGRGIEVLEQLSPASEVPEMFWVGEKLPIAGRPHVAGDWFVMDCAGGHLVARQSKLPAFGAEGRRARRKEIAEQLRTLTKEHTELVLKEDELDKKKTVLLTKNEIIKFYLDNRSDPLKFERDVQEAVQAEKQYNKNHHAAVIAYASTNDRIEKIQEPFDTRLQELRESLTSKKGLIMNLNREIQQIGESLSLEEKSLAQYKREYDQAGEILSDKFERFKANAIEMQETPKHVAGLQAKRVSELGQTLGADIVARMPSLQEVNPEDRVSVLRIWPELLGAVREIIRTDLADGDEEDIFNNMLRRRADLESDLLRQENEVRVNARNLNLHISTSIRAQKTKIDKLSQFGHAIEFGNVTGIQIMQVPQPRMLEILDQITEQPSLLAREKPIHEALSDFFEASSNGKIKLSGEQLLDYRNYVNLNIMVRRRDGAWTPAASLSGTEAIGGGLAIALMLIRSIATHGEAAGEGVKVNQIRPVFTIDEIARLTAEGQNSLMDFARREGFQLIVTGPSINPEGGALLYGLVRHYDPERLVIRGIRLNTENREPA